jgi:hypothetical protein
VLEWAERASLPAAELEDTATVRLALAACAKTLTGKAAAGSTQRRKRSVFYNALGYAVEQGHRAANPIDRIQWATPAVAQSVDRRVVVRRAQARDLLAAVRGLGDRGSAPGSACTTPFCGPRRSACSARTTCTQLANDVLSDLGVGFHHLPPLLRYASDPGRGRAREKPGATGVRAEARTAPRRPCRLPAPPLAPRQAI